MRISIDPERCTGHGRCYSLAPTLIEPDDEGHGVVVMAEVADDEVDAARKATANCPRGGGHPDLTTDSA